MTQTDDSPGQTLLPTRQHFTALDGLRGVAALVVVIFHFMEMVISDYSKLFIGHGFLAVDFFFCLSGFVIGYAYDDRVGEMGIWPFLKVRLIRLHPMVIFGSVLGLITLLIDPFRGGPLGHSAGQLSLIFLASIFLIPYPTIHERGLSLFGLNAPSWSLFWEYIANIVYAVVLYRFSRRWLIMTTVLAAIVLCIVGHATGNLWGGFNGESVWTGGARMTFSFLAGLLVYRSNWMIRTKLSFSGLSALLLLAFLMPYTEGGWKREAGLMIVYFPLLVAIGAGTKLSLRSEKFCKLSGNLSYPLYMTHYAVIWIFANYYETHKPDTAHLALVVSSGTLIMVSVAYLVMLFYDMPIRSLLRPKPRS